MSSGPERGGGARLFFALWPDEVVRAALAAWTRELRTLCGGRAPHPQDLHLTLAFLGSVEADRIGAIERAAEEVAPRAATLILDQPGYWKHNRIVWAGASAPPPALESLVQELRGALVRSGVAFDAKRFVSHVTLLRDARPPPSLPAVEPVRWEVEGFVLAGSSPRPGGRYEVLRAW